MNRVLWFGEFLIYALLAVLVLRAMTAFEGSLATVLIILAPMVLVFVFIPALRFGIQAARTMFSSLTLWHWLVLIAVVSGLNFHAELRDVKDISSNPFDAGTIVRIVFDLALTSTLLLRLFTGSTPWLRQVTSGIFVPLVAFASICILSVTWSVNPVWSLYKSVEYGFDIVLAASIVASFSSAEDYRRLFDWFWAIVGVLMILAWVTAILDPADGFRMGEFHPLPLPQLWGVWPAQTSNGLGTFGALLGIVSAGRLLLYPEAKETRGWYNSVLAFSVITMIMTDCRSAIVGFLFGVVVLLVLARKVVFGAVLAMCGALVAIVSGVGATVWDFLLRGQQQHEIQTLTGRTEWWAIAWKFIVERPLIGWGAFAGGRFVVMPHANHPELADIDSSILEPLLDTGLFSLLFLLFALCLVWLYTAKGTRSMRLSLNESRFSAECMGVLTVLTIRAFFVSNLVHHPALPFLLLVAYAEFVRRSLK